MAFYPMIILSRLLLSRFADNRHSLSSGAIVVEAAMLVVSGVLLGQRAA